MPDSALKVSPTVAARDAAILAKSDELGTTNRRILAEATGYSRARVQRAFDRAREPEQRERAPGGGRPLKHVLLLAQSVTLAAWKADQGQKLPSKLRYAMRPLRGRDGWQDELSAAVKAALQPAELALPSEAEPDGEASTIDDLRALLRSAKAKLAGDGLGSSAEQLRWIEAAARIAERIEKLRPAAEIANAIDPAEIPEAAHSGKAKLRHVVARRRRERERLVQHLLEQEKERGPVQYETTVRNLRELGELPREGDPEP